MKKTEYINEINDLLNLADVEILDFVYQFLQKSVGFVIFVRIEARLAAADGLHAAFGADLAAEGVDHRCDSQIALTVDDAGTRAHVEGDGVALRAFLRQEKL